MPSNQDMFRCVDCPEHSGTRADIAHLIAEQNKCHGDRGKMWDAMDHHNRRISERVTIKVALWTSGIAVTIFLTVITVTLQTSARIESKLTELITDVEVIKAVSVERSVHAKQHNELLREIQKFREQEASDFQEGKNLKDWTKPYGKPKGDNDH